jgi:hypothetical protein
MQAALDYTRRWQFCFILGLLIFGFGTLFLPTNNYLVTGICALISFIPFGFALFYFFKNRP